MKLVLKHESKEKKNSPACTVTEYPLHNDKMDFAIATIAGRYPEARRIVNQACDEMAYVAEGAGKIIINHEECSLSIGDVILIEAGEKYFWEGHMKLFLSCQPAWRIEQHQIVD